MKQMLTYNYDNRTLANWYVNKVMEDQASYFQVYQALEQDPDQRASLIKLMQWIDDQFLNKGKKVDLIKQSILYILKNNHSGKVVEKSALINEIINKLEVSPKVLEQATKNGEQSTLEAEISWELYHLTAEGAIQNPSKGYYTIPA